MQGTKLNHWTIQELISEDGGNGDVWKAVKDDSTDVVAIKILRDFGKDTKNEKRRLRFENEITAMKHVADLNIPRVMPLLEHGYTSEGRPWLAMPLAEKLELKSLGEKLQVLIKISDTVAQLHKHGRTHRDIKPNNILLLNNEPTLSDFGLSRIVGDEHYTKTGEQTGSFGFTGPECVGPSDEPQFSCDVYALAKTAWVLIASVDRPTQDSLRSPEDEFAILGVESDTLDLNSLQSLIFSASDRNPSKRPSARQFHAGLDLTVNSPGEKVPRTSSGSPASRVRSLLGEAATTRNQINGATDDAFNSLRSETVRTWRKSWKEFITAMGWRDIKGSGGRLGHYTKQIKAPWQADQRFYYRGEIKNHQLEVVLNFHRQPIDGTSRLIFRASISVNVVGSLSEEDESVLAKIEFDSFTVGPQFDQVKKDLNEFVSNEEFQYRAAQVINTYN